MTHKISHMGNLRWIFLKYIASFFYFYYLLRLSVKSDAVTGFFILFFSIETSNMRKIRGGMNIVQNRKNIYKVMNTRVRVDVNRKFFEKIYVVIYYVWSDLWN